MTVEQAEQMNDTDASPFTGAMSGLVPPLLATLEMAAFIGRYLHPSRAKLLAKGIERQGPVLVTARTAFEQAPWPRELAPVRERLLEASASAIDLVDRFVAAATSGEPMGLYRALRRNVAAQEALYPLTASFAPISRFFLEPTRRDDAALLQRLRDGADRNAEPATGVIHFDNTREARGGFSLYVPEYYDAEREWPLVVCLHGGSGHGRDFLWSWLAEARARGVIVLSPSSRDRTWSIIEEDDVDLPNLTNMLDYVGAHYRIDASRRLLTGMSDGATYALLAGLSADSPFTHLAPACGVLHPRLLMTGDISRAADRPIYLVHGALDWMFPLQLAHMTRDTLLGVGARLVYREIDDLSHTYPRDENPKILDWLGVR